MTIQEIYDLAIEMGIKADPRGENQVLRYLEKAKKEYKELPAKKKKYFDTEALTNPYSDTRIFVGDPSKPVKKVLAGIDADASEVLLADSLNQKGMKIDLVVGHHPIGISLTALHEVMDIQVDMYAKTGAPINVLHSLMIERQDKIKRGTQPTNHNQMIDTARLLNIPLINLHTVWDNISDKFMKDYIQGKDFDTVEEIIDCLLEIPEFQEAEKGKSGPIIVSGSPKGRTGKVVLFFTGGTNPSKEIYMELAKAGVGTIIDMHMPEDAITEAKKLRMNVINAGHMSSDSIGANIFFDVLENRGIEVIPCSGLIRVKRKGGKI